MSDQPVARAVARRRDGYLHDVELHGHVVTFDEPEEKGGTDQAPAPSRMLAASLAACTAITVEMYAERKGWDLGELEVVAERLPTERGEPSEFEVLLRLPPELSDEQVERITVIAGKCPVHRTLTGEVKVTEHVERL